MTNELPMPNVELSNRADEPVLTFELRHSLVIRASSFVIRLLRFAETTGEAKISP
jgi:hypothetical protein